MSKDKKLVKLNRLAKLKYTKLVSEEGNPESRKFQVSPWIILITLMCYAISVIMGEIFCYYTGFSRIISSENVGDYIGLFSTHCSVVFLTTSLMTMLSESSKYVYHIDLVRLVLIEPPCYNFFALVTYSLSSIVLAVLGFFVKRSSLILGGLVFGIVSIVVLFVRMVTIYYRKDYHKVKIRKFLRDTILLVREMEDEKNTAEYKVVMNKIGYARHFRAIIKQALVEAEKRNLDFVFDAIDLMEDCISWHVGKTYEDPKNVEESYKIISSNVGLKRVYHAPTKVYLEYMYIDFASIVATKYPEELQRHYNSTLETETSLYFKMLRSQVFPHILNTLLAEGKQQVFFRALSKWTQKNAYWPSISNYVFDYVVSGNAMCIAEYYHQVFYSFAPNLDEAETNYTIINKSNNSDILILDEHEQILEKIYSYSPEMFETILSFKENRRRFLRYYCLNLDEKDNLCLENNLKKLVCLSETVGTNREPNEFYSVIQRAIDDIYIKNKNCLSKIIQDCVKRIVDIQCAGVEKTNEDVDYLLTYIYRELWKPEHINILSRHEAGWSCEIPDEIVTKVNHYLLEVTKQYALALEEGIDKLRIYTAIYTEQDNPRNIKARIKILENLLAEVKLRL